jgi:hypothetical protein
MENDSLERRTEQLINIGRAFPFPETPDIAGAVANRMRKDRHFRKTDRSRLVWVGVSAALLVLILMAVPTVRAQVLEFLQIGAVRIWISKPTPTISGTPSSTFPSLADLAGETTLESARSELDFPIQIPVYPPDLGHPDRVFFQDLGGQAVLLVWMAPTEPGRVRMNLLILGPGAMVQKGQPVVLEETQVNGKSAVWMEGPHFLHLGGSMYQLVPLVVEGNILIWERDGITYRLETDLPLDEAVQIAESVEL